MIKDRNKKVLTKKSRVYLIGIPLAVFGIITVVFAIESASYGARLAHLEQKMMKLEIENRNLSASLVQSTSLQDLALKTESMGFAKPTGIHYISGEGVVAELIR